MELEGYVVIVTGAAQGIGECISRKLASEGANLFLADIQANKLSSVRDSIREGGARVETATIDITDPAQTDAMVEAALHSYGRIDALVNNAGIDCPYGKAWEIDREHWRRVIDVNLNGTWWSTQSVIPHMIEAESGKIVMISSSTARSASPEISPVYPASKAALIGLTISLSAQLESLGILVNAIAPGATGNTGSSFPEGRAAKYLAQYPLGFGGPQPIADAVSFLLRSSGDWISGAVLNISGGVVRGI